MKFSLDGYHPKLWSPITIAPQVRFRRVIPFWTVQVMLYNIGHFKNLIKDILFRGTLTLAVRWLKLAIIMGTSVEIEGSGLPAFLSNF
jgi:hypothetical protein